MTWLAHVDSCAFVWADTNTLTISPTLSRRKHAVWPRVWLWPWTRTQCASKVKDGHYTVELDGCSSRTRRAVNQRQDRNSLLLWFSSRRSLPPPLIFSYCKLMWQTQEEVRGGGGGGGLGLEMTEQTLLWPAIAVRNWGAQPDALPAVTQTDLDSLHESEILCHCRNLKRISTLLVSSHFSLSSITALSSTSHLPHRHPSIPLASSSFATQTCLRFVESLLFSPTSAVLVQGRRWDGRFTVVTAGRRFYNLRLSFFMFSTVLSCVTEVFVPYLFHSCGLVAFCPCVVSFNVLQVKVRSQCCFSLFGLNIT